MKNKFFTAYEVRCYAIFVPTHVAKATESLQVMERNGYFYEIYKDAWMRK